ncbi:hypothetical protein [uncultured Paludibaculum sp.]|uniref:hypothetical protein n=1 Tax=uncultured Paludibaculum sp. TaxID=1765020 RepID=UPI002AABED88|nr:hypothetical protein [uncultured Paludibaculum sp.]
MNLKQQIEAVVGREVWLGYEDELFRLADDNRKEAERLFRQNSRLVNIRAVLRGEDVPQGVLLLVVKDCRDGFLVQLYEGLCK